MVAPNPDPNPKPYPKPNANPNANPDPDPKPDPEPDPHPKPGPDREPDRDQVAWALLAGSLGLFAGHLPLARLAHEQLLTLLALLAPAGLPYARAFLLIDGGSRAAAAAHLAAAAASRPAALLAAVQAAFAVGVAYAALHLALCAPRAAAATTAGSGRLLLPTLWKAYLVVLPLEAISPALATARAVGAAALAVCLLGLQHGTAAEAEAEEEAAEAAEAVVAAAAAAPRLAAAGGGADAGGSAASEGQAQLKRAWEEARERADGLETSLREAQAALAQQQQQMQQMQVQQMQVQQMPAQPLGADDWRQQQQPAQPPQPQQMQPPRPAVVPTQAYSPPPQPPAHAGGATPADSPPPFGAPTPLPCSLGAMSDSTPQVEEREAEERDAAPDRDRHAAGTPFVLSRQPAAGLPVEATRLASPPIPGRPPPLISPDAEGFDGDGRGAAGPPMSSPPKGPMVPKMRSSGTLQAGQAGRPTTPRRSMMGSVVAFDNTNQTRRSTTPRRC